MSLESASKQDILINQHAVDRIVMDLDLPVSLIRKHPRKIHHSLTTPRQYCSILFTVLWLPNFQSKQLIPHLIRTLLSLVRIV